MIRLDLKRDLIKDCCDLFVILNRHGVASNKHDIKTMRTYKKRAAKEINRDFKKGIREINKKAKVFVELPELKAEDCLISPNKKNENAKEIVISTPAVVSSNSIINTKS